MNEDFVFNIMCKTIIIIEPLTILTHRKIGHVSPVFSFGFGLRNSLSSGDDEGV